MYQNDPMKVLTGKVRASYCHLVHPRASTTRPTDPPKYSVTLLIPKADAATKAQIDAAISAAITDGVSRRWNGSRPAQPATPIHDGDGLKENGERFGPECAGCWVITASDTRKPDVVDTALNPIIDEPSIYSGMYIRATIRFFAYNSPTKKGIGCGLGNVQKLEDGEALGAKPASATDDFGSAPAAPVAPAYPQPPAAPTYPAAPQGWPSAPAAPQGWPSAPAAPQGWPTAPAAPYTTGPAYGQAQ